MKRIFEYGLKVLRKAYTKVFQIKSLQKLSVERDPQKVSDLIYSMLTRVQPGMIARFGAFELSTLVNYLGVKEGMDIWGYIKGKKSQWWWNETLLQQMNNNAGFFPNQHERFCLFSELMLEDMKELDILGSWLVNENYFKSELSGVTLVQREIQNPFFVKNPWTRALKGKRILVIHPFADLITYQYTEHREQLFENKDILPLFSLETIQAVQSLGGDNDDFEDWFAALEWMKIEMDKREYDICLIGCGAYGFPLAAHAKRKGKKSVHLGGSLQLLFGIKGKRWEDPSYNKDYNYAELMNEYWVRPGERFKPKNSDTVEGGCYW